MAHVLLHFGNGASMAEKRTSIIVVVNGSMNPTIHHAAWYRYVGLISEDEFAKAVGTSSSFSTPPISQVATDKFRVVCQEGRWEISTKSSSMLQRVVDIAFAVFDSFLPHTPVSAFGLNFNYRCQVEAPSAGRLMAGLVESLNLGLLENGTSGEFSQKAHLDGRDVLVKIHVAKDSNPSLVGIDQNFNYVVEQGPAAHQFSLKDKYGDRVERDFRESSARCDGILAALNSRAQG